jgi:CRP/FNR family transcriptional regulator
MPETINTATCSTCMFKSLIFQKLEKEELDYMDQFKVEKKYKKGEIVVVEGAQIKEFLYLKNGLVKLFKTGIDLKDHIISIAKPFDFIGFLSVFSKNQYQYSITCIEDSVICFVDMDSLKNVIKDNGKFALDILSKMSLTLDDILSTRIDLCSRNLRGRISLLLLFFANDVYHNDSFKLPLTRKEIAGLIEMTTENVIRILSEFRKDGLIHIDGSTIQLTNKKLLEAISTAG